MGQLYQRGRIAIVLASLFALLCVATSASAECASVLWGVWGGVYEPLRSFDTSKSWRAWWSDGSVKAKCEEAAQEISSGSSTVESSASRTRWTRAGRRGRNERTVSPVWQSLSGEGGELLAVHLAI